MIRPGTARDIPVVVSMAEDFWQETIYRDEEFQPSFVSAMIQRSLDDELCVVYEYEDKVIGFVCGVKGPILANEDVFAGTEIALWVEPDYRGSGAGRALIEAIEARAKECQIKYWNMVYMEASMPDEVRGLYKSMGYRLNESLYTKVL